MVDEELCSLGLLLGDLLVFNGLGKLSSEGKVGDGDIIEDDMEVLESIEETVSDLLRNLLSLREQLSGVVTRYY